MNNAITGLFNNIASAIAAVVYYMQSAISTLAGSRPLMIFSIIMLLTVGKSVKLGRALSFSSKK